MKYTIYGILDEGPVQYVGQTMRPVARRLRDAKNQAARGFGRRYFRWLRDHPKATYVELEVLEGSPWAARRAEFNWIKKLDPPLNVVRWANHDPGIQDGNPSHRSW